MPKPISSNSVNKSKPSVHRRDKVATEQLSVQYDALNAQITAAEAKLKSLKPLGDTWVTYDFCRDEDGFKSWELIGLQKFEGKWRLMHATDHDGRDYDESLSDLKPLVECPVPVRVKAAKKIRELHEKIVADKEAFIPELQEVINDLGQFLLESD